MNYPQSEELRQKIEIANKILLSCHAHPDADTVGCATALKHVLEKMGKQVTTICPDEIPSFLQFINGAASIQKQKFEDFDFTAFDLYIVCDTASWQRVFIDEHFTAPQIPVVVIDNHSTNKGFGQLNILDYETSSVCEMLYFIFEDWGVTIDAQLATVLLAGILGDTGSFQFEVHKKTFQVADALLQKGADRELIDFNLFNNIPLELIKFWGVAIDHLTVDPAGFAYVALPFSEYESFSHVYGTRETAVNLVVSKLAGTRFGFILTENEPNNISVSFRSRTGVDISKIASALGGGGHPAAAGAWLRNTAFDDGLNMVIMESRKVLQS